LGEFVDLSVNLTVSGAIPLVTDAVNWATGTDVVASMLSLALGETELTKVLVSIAPTGIVCKSKKPKTMIIVGNRQHEAVNRLTFSPYNQDFP